MSLTRLEWAQCMAAKGINVFVVQPNSKRPLDGHSWYLRQTDDPGLVESWFEQTPDCNYGLHLGENYVVIDLDCKPGADGVVAFEDLCKKHGIDNFLLEFDTLIVKTPSGGYHLYFKAPFPCANRNSFPDGIDVRGVIGYVVGPGSADSRGEWEIVDPETEIAELPEWLQDYVEKPGYKDPNNDVPVTELDQQENVDHATRWLKEREPAVEGQNGDDWTYETVQWLRDFGLSEVKIVQVLEESGWNKRCDPPWSEAELTAKVENAWRYGQNRPGVKSPTYKVEKLTRARPDGGWGAHLTEEQMAELFHPTTHLSLVVDNTEEDDEIPDEVPDDEFDPELDEHVVPESLWHDMLDFSEIQKVRDYVIHKWLIAHGITHLIAKRGTGKSTVALDMAFHIACDEDWCGIPTQTGWKVIYICGEDDEGMILNAQAWMRYHEKKPERNRFLVASDIIKLTDDRRLKIRLKEMIKWADGAPCVVILDTWQRATSGWAKNDQEQMERAVERAEYIARHLNGPMLSCVHPPKDGRMTIVGSGVQEDTSTGIMSLERESDGVRLQIDRMKGPGEGNYMKFEFVDIDLDRNDHFGKPLTGRLVHKTGGTEDMDKVEAQGREERIRRAWGEAIRGVSIFPHQDNDFEPVTRLNLKQVADFLGELCQILRSGEDDPREVDAQYFLGQYLTQLEDYENVHNLTSAMIYKRLQKIFDVKVPPNVPVNNGAEQVSYIARTKTGKQKVFVLSKRERDD